MRINQRADAVARRSEAPEGELDFGTMGRVLWQKRLWIIGPTLVTAALAIFGVNFVTPKYKSESRILVEGRESVFVRPEADRSGDRDRAVDAEGVQSQVQLILSRDLALQVIKQLKLNERPEFDPVLRGPSPLRGVLTLLGLVRDPLTMTPDERLLESYYARITAYPVDKSRVIVVEFQSSDPDLAARAANAIAERYLELQQAARLDQTRAASRWLAGEIDVLRSRVQEAESRVEAYRAKSNLLVGTNNTTLSNQQLGELNTQVSATRSQKADVEARARMIRDMLRRGVPIEASEVLNSELIRRLSEQRATLQGQLAEQSSTLLDQHPRIKELRAQVGDIDRQIRFEAEKIVRMLENDARIAGARVESLNANLDQVKRQAASTNDQDVQLRALDREAKAQRELLEAYLGKYREATARDSLGAAPGDARVISRATVSNIPASPKKIPVVLVVTLATLVLTAGMVVSGELLAMSRRSAAEAALGEREFAPIIGPPTRADPFLKSPPVDLPADPRPERTNIAASLQVPTTVGDGASEFDAIARSLIEAEASERRVSIIGAQRGAGSTVMSVALARRLAASGRVALVDLALDAPALAAISIDPAAPGIADLVLDGASFGRAIVRDRGSRVQLVSAGRRVSNPEEVWRSERLAMTIDALARSYDFLVIDAGVVPAAAAARLARLAPRAVLVSAGAPADVAVVARERLIAAGFSSITAASRRPPQAGGEGDRAAA